MIELQGEIDDPLSQLEISTPLYHKWTDPAGRKSVRI